MEKLRILSKDKLKKHQKETDTRAEFAKKVALSKLKNEDLLPDEQWQELQDEILKRRKKEKEMKKDLNYYMKNNNELD